MAAFRRRIARLLQGLFLFALGIAVTLQAQIGYAPWDTFHVGVAKTTGLSVGTASIAVGLAVLLVTALLRESRPGDHRQYGCDRHLSGFDPGSRHPAGC